MKALPPLGDAADLCAGVSSVMSSAARAPYGEEVRNRIVEADRGIGTRVVPRPVSEVHQIAGNFLLAAGDFIHGIHAVLRQKLDLAYSTGSMARSACEYAAKGWWLLEPGTNVSEQASRMIAVLRAGVRDEERLTGVSPDLVKVEAACNGLAEGARLDAKKGIPPTQQLLTRMAPGDGERHWRHLCATVHGGVFAMLRIHHSVMQGHLSREYEEWFRVIVGCGYGLQCATNRAQHSGCAVEHLEDMVALHAHWYRAVDAWAASQQA